MFKIIYILLNFVQLIYIIYKNKGDVVFFMNNFIIQVFLSVLLFGGISIALFFLLRGLFSPKKMSQLRSMIKSGNYKQAVNVAKDILNRDKENIEAHYYLGDAYYNQGKNELSLIEYKRAEQRGVYDKIDEKILRTRLGELYAYKGDLEEALKEYVLLTKKFSSEAVNYFRAGELFERKNFYQQAVKYYHDAVKIDKNYTPAIINLGVLLYKSKNNLEARKFIEAAINREPSNAKAYFYLGMLDKQDNNFKGALKNLEKAMRDKEFKLRSLMERGIILMSQGKYEDASVELDRALRNSPAEDNVKLNIRYVLASCYELRRNITEAIQLWEEIYAIKPNFKDVADKLSNYQDLRVDDRMKDFLTATDVDFVDICKGIIEKMGLNILEQDILSKDSIEFFCLEPDTKWRNMRKRPKIIHITRRNDPVDEAVIRNLNEKMREKNIIRGVVITSSGYSKAAAAFAKERPIELVDKNGLQDILKQVTI